MKGSDSVDITVNIGGELFKIKVNFNEQDLMRDAERDVKQYIDKLKKSWNDVSDRKILAMTAFHFANWYHKLLKIQEETYDLVRLKCQQLDNWDKTRDSEDLPETSLQ